MMICSRKKDSLRAVAIILLTLCFLLAAGCSSLDKIDPDYRDNIKKIDTINEVDYAPVSILPKPVPTYDGDNAILNQQEFTKLYMLYANHKTRTADFNELLRISREQSKERNSLLLIAQNEERRANRLNAQLVDERNARIQEQRIATVEKTGAGIVALLLLVLIL